MTFHEHLVKEILDSFDKGILTRERLELLCNDLLKSDSLFTELLAEHISSKSEQQAVIKFLKKELIHKTCYRQVMKRQYRELKQQMKADNERHTQSYSELVTENARLKHIARYNCIEWHDMEKNPDDFPPKDPEHYGFSISVMCDDGGTAYANLDEKRWCTSRTIKAWFKIPKYLTFKYDGVVR